MEQVHCPKCNTKSVMLNGHRRGRQQYMCKECEHFFRGEQLPGYVERKQFTMNEKTKSANNIKNENIRGVHKDDLKKKYDVGRIIDEKLGMLKPDGMLLPQSQFIDFCGIAGMKYTDILTDPKYEAYRGKLGGTIFWGHPDDIKDMKVNSPMR